MTASGIFIVSFHHSSFRLISNDIEVLNNSILNAGLGTSYATIINILNVEEKGE